MPTLTLGDMETKPHNQTSTYSVACDECGLIYSAGAYVAGSERDREGRDASESMQSGHAEAYRGHQVRLYLEQQYVLVHTAVSR